MGASDNIISDQYKEVCKERFASIDKRFDDSHKESGRRFDEVISTIKDVAIDLKEANKETNKDVKEINKLLTKGNGKPSVLVQLANLTEESNKFTWYKRAIITAFICLIVFCLEENVRYNYKLKTYTRDILHSITIDNIEREAFPVTYIPKKINDTP